MEHFFLPVVLGLLVPLLILWPLEWGFPGWKQPRWRADAGIDVLYWVSLPILRGLLLGVLGLLALAFGIPLDRWVLGEHGPLAQLPIWAQVLLFLVLFDLASYWIHRWFHSATLWRYHAIHHSSPQLDWLSTLRHHPVNDVAMRIGQSLPGLLLGFSPQVLAWVLPLLTLHSLLIHANVKWTFGPLGYLIVSPAYHHWHHTRQPEGRDKNFAEICPVWDWVFGSYHSAGAQLPEDFGIEDATFPQRHFWAQWWYPFRRPEA